MSYKVNLTKAAAEDFINIYEYIAFKLSAPATAKRLIRRLQKNVLQLDELPRRFATYVSNEWNKKPLHKMVIDNYLVFYTIDEESLVVDIIRVIYSGRDFDEQLKIKK